MNQIIARRARHEISGLVSHGDGIRLSRRMATALRVFLAGALGAFFGVSGLAGDELGGEDRQPLVYVLANDNTITPGYLEGFSEGYLRLRLPDKILRFSPSDFLGVFFSEQAAREGLKRFLLLPEHSADTSKLSVEKFNDPDFLRALAAAQEKNVTLLPAERLAGAGALLTQARDLLLLPQIMLRPEEALPVFQLCVQTAPSRAAERTSELLRQYLHLVESAQLTTQERVTVQRRVQYLLNLLSAGGAVEKAGAK